MYYRIGVSRVSIGVRIGVSIGVSVMGVNIGLSAGARVQELEPADARILHLCECAMR